MGMRRTRMKAVRKAATMTDDGIRRILLALEDAERDAVLIDATTRMASALRAELVAMFVEDENLLRLAALPFAREWSQNAGTPRRLDTEQMESELKQRGERLRALLEQKTAGGDVRWSFKSTRGHSTNTLTAHSGEFDLLVVQHEQRIGRLSARASEAADELSSTAECSVMVTRTGWSAQHPVAVLLESPEDVASVLPVAAQFARLDGNALLVLLAPREAALIPEFEQASSSALSTSGINYEYITLTNPEPANLRLAVAHGHAGLLVLRQNSIAAQGERRTVLLDQLGTPVIFVRQASTREE